jgi:flagellar L-ring protein precursor FlgH
MRTPALRIAALLLICVCASAKDKKKKKDDNPTPLQKYVQEADKHNMAPDAAPVSGSLFSANARFSNLAMDLRATRVDDLVTIVVAEQASAVATGDVKTSRQSSVQSGIAAAGGITRPTGPWANLANAATQTQLQGTGETSRGATLTANLSARVTHVLPNGYLVIEGIKRVQVNSENQIITVRGVIRPVDLTTNTISSNQIAQMEVEVDGKGVVGDAIRRPHWLYRLLLGLLPF